MRQVFIQSFYWTFKTGKISEISDNPICKGHLTTLRLEDCSGYTNGQEEVKCIFGQQSFA
jgi:hypothetical protein